MGPNAWKEVVKNVATKRKKIVDLLLHGRHSSKHIEAQIMKDIDFIHKQSVIIPPPIEVPPSTT
jgi:hypothetical protein